MKVTLLTTVNSRKSGGLFYSVKYLAKNLNRLNGIEISITSYSDEFSNEDLSSYEGLRMNLYKNISISFLKKLGFSFNIHKIIKKVKPDIIHQQGIWMYHSFANRKYTKKHRTISIISPRGMLDHWLQRNSSTLKKLVGYLYESNNLKYTDCFHALCLSEMNSIRQLGYKNPIAIIPNGTEIPKWERSYSNLPKEKTLLYLGRLDSKKGIDNFLQAVAKIKARSISNFNNWKIVIAGWGNLDYINLLKWIIYSNGLNQIIEIKGSFYGSDKINLLKKVDAFILPSYSEGLPMAILEAWAYGLPVLMTEYCNIPEGFKDYAAVEIDTNSEIMAIQLTNFFNLSNEELMVIGRNGRVLVESSFSWIKIAQDTSCLYSWLLGNGDKPSFVHL